MIKISEVVKSVKVDTDEDMWVAVVVKVVFVVVVGANVVVLV